MNTKKLIIIIVIILIIVLTIGVYTIIGKSNYYNFINNSSNHSINSSTTINFGNTTVTPIIISNNNLTVIPNDYLINNITWKSYPNLEIGYVIENEVLEPNAIVNHSYIAIEIATEVKDTDNDTIINSQLSAIATEVRHIYGPNTAIVIMGMDHGVLAWSVTMKVYDDNIY
jgi:hypothetical protein